jgi:hypothetical protein
MNWTTALSVMPVQATSAARKKAVNRPTGFD